LVVKSNLTFLLANGQPCVNTGYKNTGYTTRTGTMGLLLFSEPPLFIKHVF